MPNMASGSTPRVDRIDQQLSDTVSVASTVKISNVASQKVDSLYMGTRNDSGIRKKVHYNIAANRGLEIAPKLSTTDKSSANRGKKNEYNVLSVSTRKSIDSHTRRLTYSCSSNNYCDFVHLG
jgi:hypothetical protein